MRKFFDKKVIYLDQCAFSNMLKPKEDKFWRELRQLTENLVLDQLAIFPSSSLHLQESLVCDLSHDLQMLMGFLGGDCDLKDPQTVLLQQLDAFATSWIKTKKVPEISFNVDDILTGDRNSRVSNIFITAAPMSGRDMKDENGKTWVDNLRESRDQSSEILNNYFKECQQLKNFSLKEFIKKEQKGFGLPYLAYILWALKSGNIKPTDHRNIIYVALWEKFKPHCSDEQDLLRKIIEFLQWEGLEKLPVNKIRSYLFGALARKAVNGQKKFPSKGMLLDIQTISSYMPYPDAMFIDKECAELLKEQSPHTNYKTRIFSQNNKDEFIAYLKGLKLNSIE